MPSRPPLPPEFAGRVTRGQGLGRRLGFPTANLRVARPGRIPSGVYRVEVSGRAFPRPRLAVMNVGTRPTVTSAGRRSIEVHIPGFRGLLYGKRLNVSVLARIRPERRFPSLAALKARIRRDVAAAVLCSSERNRKGYSR